MKLRPRFFDGTAFKKDITRFAPLWGLYLIGGLMIALSVMGEGYRSYLSKAELLSGLIGYFGIINLVYAMLCAQTLHGDIFNSKLCNALHAMPPRRESWFATHTLSGLLFSLVPNLALALAIMPFLREFWYTALVWLLGMQLHFLFFFGLATFSMHCTGNRFAGFVVYTILNFFFLLVAWFVSTMYQPLLYGVVFSIDIFLPLCPVAQLCIDPRYFSIIHGENCPCYNSYREELAEDFRHIAYWGGMGDAWGYLILLAVLGLVFLALALLLYRRRQLETAGDFVAFKVLRPIFWVLFALCAGGSVQLIGVEMLGFSDTIGYIFLALGLVCGYFVAQMLIARSVKVFKKRNFLYLGVFLAAFVLSLVFTRLDLLGIARYIPDTDQVEKVYLTDYELSDRELERLKNNLLSRTNVGYQGDTPAEIDRVRAVHSNLYHEGEGKGRQSTFCVTYVLKSGAVIRRAYYPAYGSEAARDAWALQASPEATLGAGSLEELLEKVSLIVVEKAAIRSASDKESLLEALWKDAQAGCLLDNYSYHYALHRESGALYSGYLCFNDGTEQGFGVYACAKNTLEWLEDNDMIDTAYGEFVDFCIYSERVEGCLEGSLELDTQLKEVLAYLAIDLKEGTAYEVFDGVYENTLRVVTDGMVRTYVIYPDSQAYQYLLSLLTSKPVAVS